MVYHEDDWMDGSSLSELGVEATADGLGTPRALLQTRGITPLSYSVSGGVLDIRDDYYRPGACNACGKPGYEVKLEYHPNMGRMAIVDPTPHSEAFFGSILRH